MRENVMNKELYDEAIRSNILSRKLIEQLMESMNYSSIRTQFHFLLYAYSPRSL